MHDTDTYIAELEAEVRSLRQQLADRDARSAVCTEDRPIGQAVLLQAILRNLPFDFWARDRHERLIMQSDESIRLWGDVSGVSIDEMGLPEDVRAVWASIHSRVFAGEVVVGEKTYTMHGQERTYHDIVAPIRDGDDVLGILGINIDITGRKQAEAALQCSEERFRTILEDVHMVAVQGYDRERRVTFWNRASERLYGYTREEALGRRLEELIIPEGMRGAVVHAIEAWMSAGMPIPAGQLTLQRKDGAEVHVYSSHVMFERMCGDKEMFCVDVDLTDVHAAQDVLRRAKEEAEAASRSKSVFLANMSHEIRTPINGILGMLQLIHDTPLNEEQSEYLHMAIRSTTRLTALLSDILDLSCIEAGKLPLRMNAFNLEDVRSSLLDLLHLAAKEKGLRLEFAACNALPRRVRGDVARLRQILFNLVGNAIKFTTQGFVRVECALLPATQRARRRLLFCVTDSGCGIPDDRLMEIFEPFVQGENSYVRQHQGAGLGLAIVKRLVQLLEGTLSIDSSDEGTTICFALPFEVLDDALPLSGTTIPASAPARRSLRILLAEDDAVNLLAARHALEKAGHRVAAAVNGQQAVQLVHEQEFDAILMDVQMPVMDGLEATRRIRAATELGKRAHIPIIALTAYAMSGDSETFLAAGMDAHLPKPVRTETMLAVLERVHAQHHQKVRPE